MSKMTVKDLKVAIADLPDEMEVILQKDPEGNGYAPLTETDDHCVFIEDESEVVDTRWTAEEACQPEQEWEEFKQRPKCLLLVPLF